MALRNERHVQDAFVVIPQDSRKNALRAGILPILFFTMDLKYGYRNPTGFRRWVKVAKSGGLCYTCVMGTWKSKTDTSICYSIILFSYASIERNC